VMILARPATTVPPQGTQSLPTVERPVAASSYLVSPQTHGKYLAIAETHVYRAGLYAAVYVGACRFHSGIPDRQAAWARCPRWLRTCALGGRRGCERTLTVHALPSGKVTTFIWQVLLCSQSPVVVMAVMLSRAASVSVKVKRWAELRVRTATAHQPPGVKSYFHALAPGGSSACASPNTPASPPPLQTVISVPVQRAVNPGAHSGTRRSWSSTHPSSPPISRGR
jgi:hypothetical protein